jgi:hypothetical protein
MLLVFLMKIEDGRLDQLLQSPTQMVDHLLEVHGWDLQLEIKTTNLNTIYRITFIRDI